MKLNVGPALLVIGIGVIIQGICGGNFDYLGTYMMGTALIGLGAGLVK